MTTVELDVQRRLTAEFIRTQPVVLVLKPRVKGRTATGGFEWQNGVPRPAQTMRLIEAATGQGLPAREPVVTADGIARRVELMLLGEWDATIGLFDVFTHDGYDWEIVEMAHFNGWERRASVARHG